jgi:hypothetical protein
MNKRATENYIFMFLTVASVSSDSIVKGIIDDIINTAVETAEVDEQKTKYLQHFINKDDTMCSQIYFRFSSYLLRKPHLFVILTAIG